MLSTFLFKVLEIKKPNNFIMILYNNVKNGSNRITRTGKER